MLRPLEVRSKWRRSPSMRDSSGFSGSTITIDVSTPRREMMPDDSAVVQAGSVYFASTPTKRPLYPYQPPSSSAVYRYNGRQEGKPPKAPSGQQRNEPSRSDKHEK